MSSPFPTRSCAGCDVSLEGAHPTRKWCSDRCRKGTLYAGTCEGCGARTDGSNGRDAAPKLCLDCTKTKRHADRKWTPDRIVAAMRDFNDRYGHPPTAYEWNPPHARRWGRDDWSERFHADGCWPWVDDVQTEFGSWNAGIEAAGFEPRGSGDQLYRRVAAGR